MIDRTIKILTPHHTPYKTCVMGNQAIARAAIEAGVNGVFSYPGTPSTEISEIFNHVNNFQTHPEYQRKYPELTGNPVYFEYSINEKIALEKAIAFSIGNRSAMCVMKNVGMNVASDPLMSITYQMICAPLVIVVCDDPGCHSSSNEQDSRYWGPMASVPVFNPSTPQEAFAMMGQAFRLSDTIKLPVIVRTTTRVSHTRGLVNYGNIVHENTQPKFDRLTEHINIPARTAAAHNRLLDKLRDNCVMELLFDNSRVILEGANPEVGIITSGVASVYVLEILNMRNATDRVEVLELGMIHPFPEKEVLAFLQKNFKKYLVLEELDPIVENAVRGIAQRNNLHRTIEGKGFAGLTTTGEFSIDLLTAVLQKFVGAGVSDSNRQPLVGAEKLLSGLPVRPPVLCSGCPHRATFYLLKLAIPREQSELILCGDIGCFGLGALPPLKMIDTINHMGMSISMAQGLAASYSAENPGRKVVALLGDGTFFHSGLTSLVNAVYTRANILVVIFDNRTIGMTGHQDHPGASHLPKYHQIDIARLLKGIGIEVVESMNPFDIRDGIRKLDKAMKHDGVSVVIAKAPCIFLPDFKDKIDKKMKIVVDHDCCNTCANHRDLSLNCSRCYSPKNNLHRAKAKLFASHQINGQEQLCPANICNHGFFNSIQDGDLKSAIEIVRDKMLFARTCGDICHRPCELFSHEKFVVPIKRLKKFVSSRNEIFSDFSIPIERTRKAERKNLTVAIIGAGPAGLSAAYDLAQAGYDITIFEKENRPGGMVAFAIPDFRMDKEGLQFEAMQLENMGVKFRFGAAMGLDFQLEEFANSFDAVILAIGMNKAKKLESVEDAIPAEAKCDALAFLRSYNDGINCAKNANTILIIGGGNSAMDAARAAKKSNPLSNVIVSCIEASQDMPAFAEEINHARAEGIAILDGTSTRNYVMNNEHSIIVQVHEAGSGEFLTEITVDFIITAIGQTTDVASLGIIGNEKLDDRSRITNVNGFTTYKNIFVAGDIASGNSMSVIGAIASGKRACVAVRQRLENYEYEYEGKQALERLNLDSTPVELLKHSHVNENDVTDIDEFNLFQACMKCNHCIDNFGCPAMVKVNGKIQIDHSRCTLCGLCIDVCPNNAIHWETEEATHG